MKFTVSIKRNNVFRYILKKGKFFKGKYIVLYIFKDKQEKKNSLGICVNKKHGISVHRNRMKRWVREAYTRQENSLKKGYSIVVLYKRNVTVDMLNYDVICSDLSNCFKGLELYDL
jgi:ribonuclease P protein component